MSSQSPKRRFTAANLIPGKEYRVVSGLWSLGRQVMENVRVILDAAGSSFRRVVKCTVILARRSDWPAMNEIYQSYWPDGDYPARTAFEAPLPHPDFLIDVECVAEVE